MGVTVNDALLFIFKEMVDNKSAQLQMQMNNEMGGEIEMTVNLSGEFCNISTKKNIKEKKKEPTYNVPMVS